MTATQRYRVSTSADDAWQTGLPGTHWTPVSKTVGGNCRNQYASQPAPNPYVLSSAFRFPNVQLEPGRKIADARLLLSFYNDGFAGVVTEFLSPVCLELSADSNDFVFQPDIVNRPRTDHVDWLASPVNGEIATPAYTSSPNLAPFVNAVLALPGWKRSNALTVIVFGEQYSADEEAEYAHRYGWSTGAFDCHYGLPPALTLTPA